MYRRTVAQMQGTGPLPTPSKLLVLLGLALVVTELSDRCLLHETNTPPTYNGSIELAMRLGSLNVRIFLPPSKDWASQFTRVRLSTWQDSKQRCPRGEK